MAKTENTTVSDHIDMAKFKVTDVDVWRIYQSQKSIAHTPIELISKPFNSVRKSFPWLTRFIQDMYEVDNKLLILYFLAQVFDAFVPAIDLYLSNLILSSIEASVRHKHNATNLIVSALIFRILLLALRAIVSGKSQKVKEVYTSKAQYKFQEMNVMNKLQYDLQTYKEQTEKESNEDIMECFRNLVEVGKSCAQVATHVVMLSAMSRQSQESSSVLNQTVFTSLCLLKPLWEVFAYRSSLWNTAWLAHATNPAYLRVKTLVRIVKNSDYIQEIISSDMAGYIISEYRKARQEMGELTGAGPYRLLDRQENYLKEIFAYVSNDFPVLFFGFSYIIDPSAISVSSLALLQQSSSSIQNALWEIQYYGQKLPRAMETLEKLYKSEQVVEEVLKKNGNISYPREGFEGNKGMTIELKNVSFNYPSSKTTQNAISNISLTFKSGDLIVIVGSNGSGKSTIVKLLNRLYDVEDGEILVDGQSIKDYDVRTLRHAIADLSQEHHLLPFSIRENIGIGLPSQIHNIDMIKSATQMGGALKLVQKYEDQYNTILNPVGTKHYSGKDDDDMNRLAKIIEKQVETSGGEKQRLVASRTFMRLNSDAVRLITVDEPSSAMDPEGELQLFQRLRKSQNGRTMLLVTHRFGHLTPYADRIICMKDGLISETGTHLELLKLDGEYAKLYNIQAKAYDGSMEADASREKLHS